MAKTIPDMSPEDKVKYIAEHRDDLDLTLTKAKIALIRNKSTTFLATASLSSDPHFTSELPFPTAAANGKDVMIDPIFWDTLSPEQQMRVLFHEGFHNIFGHCDIKVNSQTEAMLHNIAADCVVESIANECNIGKGNYMEGCINPTHNGTVEFKINGKKLILSSCHNKSVEEIYAALMRHVKENPTPPGKDGPVVQDPNGKGYKPIDNHDLKEASEEERNNRQSALRRALVEHKMKDTMPGMVADMIEEMLKGKINWRAELREMIIPEIKSHLSPKKRNRRTMGWEVMLPGVVKEGIDVTFAIDTSGSIGQNEIKYYLGEIENLFRQFDEGLVNAQILMHHSKVYNVFDVKSIKDLEKIRTESGGTSHKPVFAAAEEMDSKVLICLTDGFSSFPEDTKIRKTLWIVTTERGMNEIPDNLGKKIHVSIEDFAD